MKNQLVLTGFDEEFDNDYKKILLGDWIKEIANPKHLKSNYKTPKYHWSDSNKVERDSIYLKNLF